MKLSKVLVGSSNMKAVDQHWLLQAEGEVPVSTSDMGDAIIAALDASL